MNNLRMRSASWCNLVPLIVMLLVVGSAASAHAALGSYLNGWGSPYKFAAPEAITFGPDGHLYLADGMSPYLSAFDASGNCLRRFSPPGASGGFADVAVAQDGRVYAIGGPGVVAIFEADGTFVKSFGSEGAGDGQFYWAVSLAVSASGEVFVADWWNHRVSVFDRNGAYLRKWNLTGSPTKMVFDARGRLYMADYYGSVYAYDPINGVIVDRWYVGGNLRLPAFAIDDAAREAYVVVEHTGEVLVYSLDDTAGYNRQPLRAWHGDESGIGRVTSRAKGLAVDAAGTVFIAEGHNYYNPETEYSMVKLYDRVGSFQNVWRASGDTPGRFSFPTALSVRAGGRTYVVDSGNRRIQVFTAEGVFVTALPLEEGWSVSEIEVADNGDVYLGATGIVDGLSTYFVRVLNPSGAVLRQWPIPTVPWTASAGGFAVSGDRVYVSFTQEVLIFTLFGEQVGSIFRNPYPSWYDYSLRSARDVEAGPDGLIYVLEARGVIKYTLSGEPAGWTPISGLSGLVGKLAVDPCGNIWTLTTPASYWNPGLVRAFDSVSGQLLGQWGGQGVENGQFNAPLGIAADEEGRVFIVERDNHRIQVFEGSGACGQPVAAAGPDLPAHPGRRVVLDGSTSTDPAGRPLTYAWRLVSTPEGSAAVLSEEFTATPAFTPDMLGGYVIELTVTNNHGFSGVPDQVLVTAVNEAPVADAGPDQAVIRIGTSVTLAGKGFDPDGDPLTYAWRFDSLPVLSTASLSDSDSADPSFLADRNGSFILSLTVTDAWGGASTDTVLVSFTNLPPVADAGLSQSAIQGALVLLDGAASSDPNGDVLTFGWQIAMKPAGSAAELFGANTAQPSFVADSPGQYALSLVVHDGIAASAPSIVTIAVVSHQDALTSDLGTLLALINSFPDVAFDNKNNQKTLGNKINAVIAMVEGGDYIGALQKMRSDLLPKMDGCALGDGHEANDWLSGCAEQDQSYPLALQITAVLEQLLL